MLANDGVIYFPVNGNYLINAKLHSFDSVGAIAMLGWINSSGLFMGVQQPCYSGLHYGNDGYGVTASGVVGQRFAYGDHMRFGGYATAGGSVSLTVNVIRLPI